MATNQNDIIINAKANTKEAEANITKLDATVKGMAAGNISLVQAQGRMTAATAASTAALGKHNKELATTNQLQKKRANALNFLKDRLKTVAVGVGALVAFYKLYNLVVNASIQANKELAQSMASVAKAEQQSLDNRATASKNALEALQQLNDKAKEGALDTDAIQLENNLVKQLNDIWGDVGLSINNATGEIQGLLGATQEINENLRQQQISALTKQISAQRLKTNAAKEELDNKYNSNGTVKNNFDVRNWGTNVKGAARAVAGGGFEAWDKTVQADYNNMKAAYLQEKAALEQLQTQLKALQTASTQEELNRVLRQNAERQKAEATIFRNDPQEQALMQNLAHAQMTGGDVAGARAELNNYIEQKNQARYEELSKLTEDDNTAIDAARKAYEEAQKSGDNAAITEAAKALARATEIARQHTDEMAKIASGAYKPAEAPSSDKALGTFNAFGVGGLTYQNIEKEQLEVQREIAKNTRNLAKPVVAE